MNTQHRPPVPQQQRPVLGLHIKSDGAASVITLDRPACGNSIDAAMSDHLAALIPQIARDANVYAVVIKAAAVGPFCVGADLRERARLAVTDPNRATAVLAEQHAMIWTLECFSKPVVSLMNGAVRGGGASLTLVNTHRVAGADYSFSIPNVQFGIAPDLGVSRVLAALPNHIGTYLALTGHGLGRADALDLGLVTHCIESHHFPLIETELNKAMPVDDLLDQLHHPSGPRHLPAMSALIAQCFSARTLPEITIALQDVSQGNRSADARDWAKDTLAALAQAAPRAAALTLRQIRDAAAFDLRQALIVDYRLSYQILQAAEFQEGVRARIVDRDRQPDWSRLDAGISSGIKIEKYFTHNPKISLNLPTRDEMQSSRI
jgi:enoyl-CoA hydratase